MTETFKLIDEVTRLHRDKKPQYEAAITVIESTLRKILSEKASCVTAINNRIKAENSLKEKIFRKKAYKTYTDADSLLKSMRDCLGFMIECRFADEEVCIFEQLKKQFLPAGSDGYCPCKEGEGISLNLTDSQPQTMQNGVSTYKIDGRMKTESIDIVFEIQIKSLANKFWSDIEHNVIYKNNVYLPSTGYVSSLLSSLRGNLLGIDSMLKVIKDQIETLSAPVAETLDLKTLLSKLIGDLINKKMQETLGVFTRTRNVSDLLSGVLLMQIPEDETEMQGILTKLSVKIERATREKLDIRKAIVFPPVKEGSFQSKLFDLAHTDFEWHIFFVFYKLLNFEEDANFERLSKLLGKTVYKGCELSIEKLSAALSDKMENSK